MKYGLLLLLLVLTVFSGPRDGVTTGSYYYKGHDLNEATRSAADWRDCIEICVSDSTDDTLFVDSLYSTALYYARIKCFLNNSGSVATVKCINALSSRCMIYKIPAYGTTGKIPYISAIIKTGTSDSLIPLWQIDGR